MSEQAQSQGEGVPGVPFAGPPRPGSAERPMPVDARIEDYLDHVSAPLVGLVPYARRVELRAELRGHLEALVATHEELGSERNSAVVLALQQFGPPRHLSHQWAREWTQGTVAARVQPAWCSMRIALAGFGLASLLAFAALAAMTNSDGSWANSSDPVFFIAAMGLPVLAGLVTGLLAPARHALGAFYALALLILLPIALNRTASSLIQPPTGDWLATCCLLLAMAQAVWWMPLGCGAAALGGWLRSRLALLPRQWVLQ